MPNKGEKEVAFKTSTGHRPTWKVQVTGVQQPLIKDMPCMGHSDVVHQGWCLHSKEEAGQTTAFHKQPNIYGMKVEAMDLRPFVQTGRCARKSHAHDVDASSAHGEVKALPHNAPQSTNMPLRRR